MKLTQGLTVTVGLLATLCCRVNALSEACQERKEEYQQCFENCAKDSNYRPGGITTTTTKVPVTTTTTAKVPVTTTTTAKVPVTTTSTTKAPSSGECNGCLVSELVDRPPFTCDKAGAAGFCKAPWDSDNDDSCCSSATFDAFAANMGCKCQTVSGGTTASTTTTTTTTTAVQTYTTTAPTITTTAPPPTTTTSASSSCDGCLISQLVDNQPWNCDLDGVMQFCAAPWDQDGDDMCCSSEQFPNFALNMGCKCEQ